jgi:tetratricopeptide (TPR) repeat protein
MWYRRALERTRRAEVCLEYAVLLREEFKEPTEADEVINRLVNLDGRNAQTRLQAARYFSQFNQPDRAWEHLRFALDELKSPTDELLLLAADVALTRGETEEARRLLNQGAELYREDARMKRGLVQLELRRGDSEKALAPGRNATEFARARTGCTRLGNLLVDAGAQGPEPVRQVIDRLRRRGASRRISSTPGSGCCREVGRGVQPSGEGPSRPTTHTRVDAAHPPVAGSVLRAVAEPGPSD